MYFLKFQWGTHQYGVRIDVLIITHQALGGLMIWLLIFLMHPFKDSSFSPFYIFLFLFFLSFGFFFLHVLLVASPWKVQVHHWQHPRPYLFIHSLQLNILVSFTRCVFLLILRVRVLLEFLLAWFLWTIIMPKFHHFRTSSVSLLSF